ncbi:MULTISPECIES: hypothetical protein [unclassified Microbacterium]|uniref:hypothetical protein n=1 Tax=unclassified Microbacterium TaxID=2609290 RepID=UPI0028830853|nr:MULTISPECIES: hypothetical protein [unclassified Microbacterium]
MPADERLSKMREMLTKQLDDISAMVSNFTLQHLETATAVLSEAESMIEAQSPDDGLTAAEREYMVSSGAFTPEKLAEIDRNLAAGQLERVEARTRTGAVLRTLSSSDVSELLGIDDSRVRHRVSKGLLYGFMTGTKRRYPQWQFDDGGPIPHLAAIIRAFPADWPPAKIEAFMTVPKSSLRGELLGHPEIERMSPTQWLVEGGEPDVVIGIIESFLLS